MKEIEEKIIKCPYCSSELEPAQLELVKEAVSEIASKVQADLSIKAKFFSFFNGGINLKKDKENLNSISDSLKLSRQIFYCENCDKFYKFSNVLNKNYIETKYLDISDKEFLKYFKRLLKLLNLDKSPVEKFYKIIKKNRKIKEHFVENYSIIRDFIIKFYVAELREANLKGGKIEFRTFLVLFLGESLPIVMVEYEKNENKDNNYFILKRIVTTFPRGFTLEKLLKMKKRISSEILFDKININYLTMKEILVLTLYFIKGNIIKGKTNRQKILFRLYFKFLRKEGLITKEYQIIFKPHYFGPYSELLEEVIKDLKAEGKIELKSRNSIIKMTEEGIKFAESVIKKLKEVNPRFIERFKEEIERISGFDGKYLLEEIYYELFFGDEEDRKLLENSKIKDKILFKEFRNLEIELIKEL